MGFSDHRKPPGAAWRIYERLHAGGRRFVGVAVELSRGGAEVTFRWAGCTGRVTTTTEAWDKTEKEPLPGFRLGLWPKES